MRVSATEQVAMFKRWVGAMLTAKKDSGWRTVCRPLQELAYAWLVVITVTFDTSRRRWIGALVTTDRVLRGGFIICLWLMMEWMVVRVCRDH